MKSLENRGILLKETTRKTTSRERSAGMTAADAAIQKKNHGSGRTALIISNEEMENIMKIVKSLKESGLIIKGISEMIKNEGFLPILLGTSDTSIPENALTRRGVIRAGENTISAGESFSCRGIL